MATKTLLYLHGFNSSPDSVKAQQALRYFGDREDFRLLVPALPPEPGKAVRLATQLIQKEAVDGLIGSSLGGFYSLHLHAQFDLPAVLINPAARPYELLVDYIGINTNMYTGERYEVREAHMQELLDLDVPRHDLNLDVLFLLTESEDEVLDYQQAANKLAGAKMYLSRGGDHTYQSFSAHLPACHHFLVRVLCKD